MAKYIGHHNHPVIIDQVLDVVHEAMDFMSSDFCKEYFTNSNAPPTFWRHVKMHSHRACGFSTAALKLLNEYTSSMIVTHNYPSANRLRQYAIENRLVPKAHEQDFYNNITIQDHINSHQALSDTWFIKRRPFERYQLIILDGASMIEATRNNGYRGSIPGMDIFRDQLWNICDLLVELG